ncbi:hypothetical protein CYCD_12310 [Tenuifilaceae bacterium CYCD]|nr:hypothetical protein CYCD_12310 [Tenuifilaceae bacterium CYCD]
MKKILLTISTVAIVLISAGITTLKPDHEKPKYTDGTYIGKSKAIYIDENYWGKVRVKIENGTITNVDFKVIDSTNNEVFDQTYEKHFAGNNAYIQQCRNDWEGIQIYPKLLIKNQNIDDVDVISGATWSYNLFKYALEEALKKAKNQ